MSETLTQTITRLTAFIKEKAPSVDLAPGSVFNELIVGLESQIQNQVYNDIDSVSSVQAISQALNSATDTYSSVIDAIASNYDVYRNQGNYSSGFLKIYVSVNSSVFIPANTQFTQPTLGYVYTSGNISINITSLTAENGAYYFILPVTAVAIGSITAITNGVQFILTVAGSLNNFVNAFASGSFSPGLNQETDKQLIARFRNGLGTKNLLSVNSITHQLASDYPNFQSAHIEDTSSPVNIRSINNPLGIKVPNCVDVYVKNSITLPHISFTATGVWYAIDPVNGIPAHWRFDIDKNTAPGFYRVASVTYADNTDVTYLKFQTVYEYDDSAVNLIPNAASARYSRYQTAYVRVFEPYSVTPPTFNVTVIAPPSLADIQDIFLDESTRIPCADYLAKGIIPCQVSMRLSLVRNSSATTIDVVSLKADIFNYINSLKVGESRAVSQRDKICHQYNIARVDLPLVLNGSILAPYKSTSEVIDHNILISGNDFLAIPDITSKGITKQNTMFFISYFDESGAENINISVK